MVSDEVYYGANRSTYPTTGDIITSAMMDGETSHM